MYFSKKRFFALAVVLILLITASIYNVTDIQNMLPGAIYAGSSNIYAQEAAMVIPCGDVAGIKIHTDGVLVVAISYTEDSSGSRHTPAKDSGLKTGDIITKIGGVSVRDSKHFSEIVEKSESNTLSVDYIRGEDRRITVVTPTLTSDGYRIGAWIRDSTAGIGTITFFDPQTRMFAALGHGISDVDTGQLLSVANGNITGCSIASITRGKNGAPGELKGVFANNDIGIILENSPIGLYGTAEADEFAGREAIPVAARFEIQPGSAQILNSLDGSSVESYDIEIEKVMTQNNDGKGMIIRVTDPELLEKTGGIVQGMSGSPIIQNGKLVGAVTHVLVNDPTRGYGIFIELMIDKANQIDILYGKIAI